MAFTNSREVFVTVGTTQFNQLVSTILEPCVLQILKNRGYNQVTLQTGKGVPPPVESGQEVCGVRVEHYPLKASIAADVQRAGLVVAHGGAGTCLEVLEAGRPLVVVVNRELMGNHQLELAEQLQADGHVYFCSCEQLAHTLHHMDLGTLRPFPRGNPSTLLPYLDRMMGL